MSSKRSKTQATSCNFIVCLAATPLQQHPHVALLHPHLNPGGPQQQ